MADSLEVEPLTHGPTRLWHSLVRARRRFVIALLASCIIGALVPHRFGWSMRLAAGWDAGSIAMLGMTWMIIMRSSPRQTRRRAATQDPGRTTIWVIVLLSSIISLFAAAGLIRNADSSKTQELVLVGLCLGAVVSSWLLSHTSFALRYAHLYYRLDDEGEGGLTFPGDAPPDDWDFAYFAFTLGMCFQTSDVCVTSRTIRRYVLIHALLSFAYNTVILALALNLAFGLLGPH